MEQRMKNVVLAVVGLVLCGSPAIAGKASVEQGGQLFKDASLAGAKNGKSCQSCHAAGKGLEKAKTAKLMRQIKRCMTEHMEAKPLDGRSMEMKSLKMYIETLQTKG